MPRKRSWNNLTIHPDMLPSPGERVIICVGGSYVGEGYLKQDGKWYRYCDFAPVEAYMSDPVTAWMDFPEPPRKRSNKRNSP